MTNATLKNDYLHMTVMTTPVTVQKKFVTIVLNAGEVYDMAMSNTAEEAVRTHQNFCTMCSVFAPLVDKAASSDPAVREEGRVELQAIEAYVRSPSEYVH